MKEITLTANEVRSSLVCVSRNRGICVLHIEHVTKFHYAMMDQCTFNSALRLGGTFSIKETVKNGVTYTWLNRIKKAQG